MAHELKDIMTIDELAEILGCSTTTLEEAHRDRRLVGVRMGNGGLRYTREAVLRQLNKLSAPPEPDSPPMNWGHLVVQRIGPNPVQTYPNPPAVWAGAVADPARPPALPEMGTWK